MKRTTKERLGGKHVTPSLLAAGQVDTAQLVPKEIRHYVGVAEIPLRIGSRSLCLNLRVIF